MSSSYFEKQDFYDVVGGEVNMYGDNFNDVDIFPFPVKKQTNELSTGESSDYLENNENMIQDQDKEDQTQQINFSQLVIDNHQHQNDSSVDVLQCNYSELYADLQYYNPNSHILSQRHVENILLNENSFDTPSHTIVEKSTKVEKNDSKNVPKGMMKAFAHMVLDKKPETVKIMKSFFEKEGLNYEKYQQYVRKIRKSSKISIQDIRDMLLHDEFASTTRKLGVFFIRKRFISHIFNSKMEKCQIHMKYIPRWLEIFEDPNEFRSLK